MMDKLRNLQPSVNPTDAHLANDQSCAQQYRWIMRNEPTKIHPSKQPRRPHHIADWMDKYGLKAVDVSSELNVDKSVVSRWLSGSTPNVHHQERLAALFHTDREGLFRHPDDDWLAKFFKDRTKDELERIKATLEAAFPRRNAS
ncbi:helix-turn-helix transcriptional regulator [Xanthobacter sp.]|uniref:helix-turn-helix domain-containing protein n=1 Tax=Xanthobacter sp. TaxID=35809 RepID=UPI0025D1A07B|nr:helix-turn-helix transcriptional regulator [Xanthobacter sp.]